MKVVLLDGYSLMYRAYHALSTAPMTAPDGTPTTAVHGFIMMLVKLMEDERPDRMAVAFDAHAKTFRHELFDDYKAGRAPMPDDLRAQDPVIRRLISQMGIPLIELPGYEADDILGTLSRMCEETGDEALIVTGDRDSFQLVGAHTRIMYTRKGLSDIALVDEGYISEKYGVTPAQLIDVKALMGDASDNIPGVSGVGEKTATKLIAKYGDLESVLSGADAGEKGKLRERLMTQAETARMSRVLAEIDRRVPLNETIDSLVIGDIGGALPHLKDLGMSMAHKRLAKLAGSMPSASGAAAEEKKFEVAVTRLESAAELREVCESLAGKTAWVAVDAGENFSLAAEGGCWLLELGGGDLLTPGVTTSDAMDAARPLLDGSIKKYACGMTFEGDLEDAALMAYCVNPQRRDFASRSLCADEGISNIWDACPALGVKELCALYGEKLAADSMTDIYRDIELPLSRVLRSMEKEGFLVDADTLQGLSVSFREHIARLEGEIYGLAGEKFNINSPKQLSYLLFEKLGLPAPGKKKAQGYTTNAETLEALAEEYPICEKILEYRRYKKLESTYVDALLRLRDENGRVHTRFDQTATATGRISSLEPNLQNIPVRTELGRSIRGAFVAREGWVLVDADYSQIELRVLAHMAGDEAMINAFNSGHDIHRITAAEVHGISPEEVTSEMRSNAKAVNFGIVYGISDFTLARNIGVSRAEARQYIDLYFARYPGVKRYLDEAVSAAREAGYARTLMGRRRYIPELASSNFNMRSFGERCAMNSPIQGTAADIIKVAMIRVHDTLAEKGLKARLILQVHDELIVESPREEAEQVQEILGSCMESVAQLSVRLKTDISIGGNWRECK